MKCLFFKFLFKSILFTTNLNMRNKMCRPFVFLMLVLLSQVSFGQSDMLYVQGVEYKASSGETPGMAFLKGGVI